MVDPVDSALDAPTAESDAGEADTDTSATREMLTATVAVPVFPSVSVTVTSAVPLNVWPGCRFVVENEVDAEVGEPMPIPEPPDCQVHRYV